MVRLPELSGVSPGASHAKELVPVENVAKLNVQWLGSDRSAEANRGQESPRMASKQKVMPASARSLLQPTEESVVGSFLPDVMVAETIIRQLKAVIRAQHNKIEELRSSQDPTIADSQSDEFALSLNVQNHMLKQQKLNAARDEEEFQRLTSQVRRLQNQVKELRAANSDLKKLNRRYSSMISEGSTFLSSLPSSITPSSMETAGRLSASPPAVMEELPPVPEQPNQGLENQSHHVTLVDASGQSPSPSPQAPGKASTGVPKPSTLTRGCLGLWRDETPHGLLMAMMASAQEILKSSSGPRTLTLYVIDPWLRKVMADHREEVTESWKQMTPTSYYLKGKVTIDAYQRDGSRGEAPRFSDIASLPLRELGEAALPLQTRLGESVFGALQVTIPSVQGHGIGLVRSGRSPRIKDEQADEAEERVADRAVLSDSQWNALQLLVGTTVGILDMRLQLEGEKTLQDRARDCLKIAAEVGGTRTLPDFEQKVKLLLASFFNVAAVRLCFYDQEHKTLVTSPSRPFRYGTVLPGAQCDESREIELDSAPMVGRRNVVSYSLQEGIVGRCARRQQCIHLDPLVQSVEVSERVDGVDLSGRSGEINMLTGPMVAHFGEDKQRVIGTLQLIAKKRRLDVDNSKMPQRPADAKGAKRKGGPGEVMSRPRSDMCDPFTEEDQDFFSSMLKILGLAAYRTMQVQARAEEGEVPLHVVRLFQAA